MGSPRFPTLGAVVRLVVGQRIVLFTGVVLEDLDLLRI